MCELGRAKYSANEVLADVVGKLAKHGSLHDARSNSQDTDAQGGKLTRERNRHAHHTTLYIRLWE